MEVAILKYNAGNVRSVELALERIGIQPIITDDPEILQTADRVIFPGVGEAGSAMDYLKGKGLDVVIRNLRQPVLGICLGLQLLCKHSEESNTEGLGVFDALVKRFTGSLKVPHVGWNLVERYSAEGPILQSSYFYFVHSYYADLSPDTIATCTYDITFSAMLRKDNFFATQFHPEKSADAGSLFLQKFIDQSL